MGKIVKHGKTVFIIKKTKDIGATCISQHALYLSTLKNKGKNAKSAQSKILCLFPI